MLRYQHTCWLLHYQSMFILQDDKDSLTLVDFSFNNKWFTAYAHSNFSVWSVYRHYFVFSSIISDSQSNHHWSPYSLWVFYASHGEGTSSTRWMPSGLGVDCSTRIRKYVFCISSGDAGLSDEASISIQVSLHFRCKQHLLLVYWVWIVQHISGTMCPIFHQKLLAYLDEKTIRIYEFLLA